jgi:hypothetical protein
MDGIPATLDSDALRGIDAARKVEAEAQATLGALRDAILSAPG